MISIEQSSIGRPLICSSPHRFFSLVIEELRSWMKLRMMILKPPVMVDRHPSFATSSAPSVWLETDAFESSLNLWAWQLASTTKRRIISLPNLGSSTIINPFPESLPRDTIFPRAQPVGVEPIIPGAQCVKPLPRLSINSYS